MELTLEGMKNAHVEPSYRSGRSFWDAYLLFWLLPELVLAEFFHAYTDGGFAVLYGAASLEIREQLLQSVY